MKSNQETTLGLSFKGETTSQTAKVFFDNLARQNKRMVQ